MAESLSVQLTNILSEYDEEVQRATNSAITRVAREAVKKLQNTSPKKSGSYARGWAMKKNGLSVSGNIVNIVVHNKTDYQLTHLLENGHVIRNKKGEYGRTRPIKHIAPVEQWANSELPEEIERTLK